MSTKYDCQTMMAMSEKDPVKKWEYLAGVRDIDKDLKTEPPKDREKEHE